jgi:Na+/H+-translocating membrane pyrophosphatase
LTGAFTSIISGYIAMKIATQSNYRTTYCAYKAIEEEGNKEKAMASAFKCAYSAGCAMGFTLVSIALLVVTILIIAYFYIMTDGDTTGNISGLMENIAGYGLGGSTVAGLGRVGGGVYTKAADVGADLVGKVEESMAEDSPDNPATIADNVGDNVGDIAGMGSDLFGSFAESTSASLVVSGASLKALGDDVVTIDNLWYPLLVTAFGIVVCIFTSIICLYFSTVNRDDEIENRLKE